LNIIWKDRVRQAITAGGTGSIVLGNAQFTAQSLDATDENGLIFYLLIDKDGSWETGSGTYIHATKTFSRDTIYDSTNSGLPINVTLTTIFELSENSGSFQQYKDPTITTTNILGTETLPVIVAQSTNISTKWIVTVESLVKSRLFEVTALFKSTDPTFNISNDLGDRINIGINVIDSAGNLALQLINNSGNDMTVHVAQVQLISI